MLTLKAAGLLDVDAGEIVRPGIVRIENDRIVTVGGADNSTSVGGADNSISVGAADNSTSVGGSVEGDVIDLGDAILLPGLMDMEVNLLMGGRGENPGLSQVQDDPPIRMLRAVGNARRTLRAGLHHRPQPRIVRQDRRLPARRGVEQGHRRRLDRGAAGDSRGPCDHADGRSPRSDDVRCVHAGCPRADGRGGHRQRGRRDPQGGALPDQARRAADQGVRLRRGHVADRRGRRTALFGRGAARHRRRGAPPRAAGGRAHARRGGRQARRRLRDRLHRARLPDGRRGHQDAGRQRPVPGDHTAGWPRRWTCRGLRRSCRTRPPRCSPRRARRSRRRTRPA